MLMFLQLLLENLIHGLFGLFGYDDAGYVVLVHSVAQLCPQHGALVFHFVYLCQESFQFLQCGFVHVF